MQRRFEGTLSVTLNRIGLTCTISSERLLLVVDASDLLQVECEPATVLPDLTTTDLVTASCRCVSWRPLAHQAPHFAC